jgi:hypothetical protein
MIVEKSTSPAESAIIFVDHNTGESLSSPVADG